MAQPRKPAYKRVLLKISGEALMGTAGFGISPAVLSVVAAEIAETSKMGVEIAVVVGGGNIWRGASQSGSGMDRASADYVGMLATVMNAVVVVLEGGDQELAHEVAVSAAFSKPRFLSRDEVPQAEADEERVTLEGITRAEGKPEQAIGKIVEGRLNAWYKNQVLLEQPYAKDDKQTITQLLGDATIAGFAQVYIGS
jgi:hypothetical protein